MGKIVITGATGQLGGIVVRHLLDLGVTAGEIAVVVRDVEKASGLKELGLEIRKGDYDHEDSLPEAFKGADKLLFISSSSRDNTHRVKQHATVVEAARNAGVGHILYTGLAFAELAKLSIEDVHLATEAAIRTTGIPYTFLRNTFYMEVLVNPGLLGAIKTGKLATSTAGNKMNYVTRSDLALAAAIVLTSEGHQNRAYNLTNSNPFTYDEIAAILSEVSGTKVVHFDVTPEEANKQLIESGIPPQLAGFQTNVLFPAIASGVFSHQTDDLLTLIGNKISSPEVEVRKLLRQN